MNRFFRVASLTALVLGFARIASAQSSNFNFTDNTSDGWSDSGFGTTPLSTVVAILGSNYINVPRTGFQSANVGTGNTSTAFFQAMAAAAANPAGYQLSYDWYVDTSTFGTGAGTFLQIGSYVNTGSGYYAQDFAAVKEVELSGTQLASGQVFSGHVSVNFAAVGFTMPAAQTFFRQGFIENGNGANQAVDFTNISVSPVPEPATLALLGLAVPALALRRRRAPKGLVEQQ